MIYSVTKKYETGSEQPCKKFNTLEEARAFTQESAETDARMKIKVTYRIYEFDEVLDTIDSDKVKLSSSESSGSGQGQGAGSRPNPFATAPQPKGSMPKWATNKEDKDKKK